MTHKRQRVTKEQRRRQQQEQRRQEALRQVPELANCESPIERKLLGALKRHLPSHASIRVQAPIGPYRVDFLVCASPFRLVIEADGADWHNSPEQIEYDRRRDAYMTRRGYKVHRFCGSAIARDPGRCAALVCTALGEPVPPDVKKEARRARAEERQAAARRRVEEFLAREPAPSSAPVERSAFVRPVAVLF